MTQSPWWCGVAAGAGGCSLLLKMFKELARFKMLTLDDVGSCLQQPDEELISQLLDPDDEEAKLIRHRVGNYRRSQRARLNELHEHYARMYHNALLFRDWAYTQQYDIATYKVECSDEVLNRLKEMADKASVLCSACRLVLFRIRFWSIVRFDEITLIPVPSLVALRTSRGIDIPNAYRSLKTVAVKFISLSYGTEIAKGYAEELKVAI